MVTREENELLTRLEGGAPMGRLMRDNYWIPFALSSHLAHGDAPMPVRLFGDVAVAHARRILLDAVRATAAGELPPGSASTPGGVRMPNPREVLLEAGGRWEDAARAERVTSL